MQQTAPHRRELAHYLFPARHLGLLLSLTRREVNQRFKNSFMGIGWAFITPLLMLLVYTFVFRTVLNARWPGSDGGAEFALNLFCGLIVFNVFSEVLTRAPGLISEQPNMVKKVIFPLEVLPWVTLLNSYFFALLNIAILLAGTLLVRGHLEMEVLAVCLVPIAATPMLIGLAWLLAAVGVYIPDMRQITALMVTPLMFLSPVFYPSTALPEIVQPLMQFNPLTIIIEALRAVLLEGRLPEAKPFIIYFCTGTCVCLLGAVVFKKLRSGFADVL